MDCEYLQLPIFDHLTDEEREMLKKESTVVTFDNKESIFKQGSFAVNSYILLDGLCKMTYQSGEERRILRLLKKGNMVGMDYIFTTENYPYSLHALTSTKMLVISSSFLKNVFQSNPQFALFLSQQLNKYLMGMVNWFIDLDFKNTEGAVAMFILKYGDNILKLSRKEIADIIGYSRESVIHTIKNFEGNGIIAIEGKKLRILECKKLMEIAKYG